MTIQVDSGGTDASPAANRALALAIEMAVKHEAVLEIVHVIRDLQIPDNLRGMAQVMDMAGARGDVMMFVAEQVLNDARERARGAGSRRSERTSARATRRARSSPRRGGATAISSWSEPED